MSNSIQNSNGLHYRECFIKLLGSIIRRVFHYWLVGPTTFRKANVKVHPRSDDCYYTASNESKEIHKHFIMLMLKYKQVGRLLLYGIE